MKRLSRILLIGSSPLGIAMFSKLSLQQWIKLVKHSRKPNRSSGSKALSTNLTSGITSQLPTLMRLVRKGRKTPVSALDLDTASFQMLQSASTTVKAHNIHTTEKADIPWGACGRDFEETRDLVRWRCTTTFKDKGEHVWKVVFDKGSTVEALYAAISDS